MAFIVEDGTGKVDANSYCTVEFADSYFLERNMTSWQGATQIKQAALIKATDYIENLFQKSFRGKKNKIEQALSWPRKFANGFEPNQIPLTLQKATSEYALRALTGELQPDIEIDNGRLAQESMQKVGPIEIKTTFRDKGIGSNPITTKPYPLPDGLISPLLNSTSGTIR